MRTCWRGGPDALSRRRPEGSDSTPCLLRSCADRTRPVPLTPSGIAYSLTRSMQERETFTPLTADTDATTPKYLRDKYAIVGVGETTYTRGSGKTTRAMGTFAVRAAMLDAGLKPTDIDGMLSYQGGDSTPSTFIAGDLGIRLNYYM